MSITSEVIDRLKAQLLTSGLSQKNSSLYQVINQLIDALREGLNEIETQVAAITPPASTPTSGTTILSGMPLGAISDDNQETDWNWGPQGLKGDTGPIGPIGPQGTQGPVSFVPSPDGCDCECECMPFIGTSLIP